MSQPLHSAYLSSGMRALPMLPRGAGDIADRAARVQEAKARALAPPLVDEIAAQQERLPPSSTRSANVAALRESGTVVVATGQQIGLFLGPLYTVYKAASAIAWARRLANETAARVVPLFWLQTEDHDFKEIASAQVPGASFTLADDPALDRTSVSERRLGDDVTALLDRLQDAIGGGAHVAEVMALLRRAYAPGARMADAFAQVLATLFAELIVVDPRNAAFARAAAPVIARSLTHAAAIDQALIERGQVLSAAGFAEQIHTRPGSTLAFFHATGPRGPRQRLAAFDVAEAQRTLAAEPLAFSTSALLRPIVQDTLLPVALYVGGPAEVDYFGQATALYPLFDLPAPMIAMRARFRLLPARTRALLQELGLVADDLSASADALFAKLAVRTPIAPIAGDVLADLDRALDAAAADAALARAAARTKHSVHRAIDRFRRRQERAAIDRDATLRGRLERLQAWLAPGGAPQERVLCFAPFAAKVGIDAFVRALAVDPLAPALKDVAL